MINQKLTIAVQKSGRLRAESFKYIELLGLNCDESSRDLLSRCTGSQVTVLSVRDDDIPEYVLKNVADLGIVGANILAEKGLKLKKVKKLGFAKCSLQIAIPKDSKISSVNALQGARIATSYPNLLRKFLDEKAVSASIITLAGAVEVAPSLNLADAVCDLVQSGKTLKENGLKPLVEIFKSEAILISNPKK